jgi:hypothetical protein
MIPTLVFKRDFGVETKEGRKEMGRIKWGIVWLWDEWGHFGGWEWFGSAVIELDEILLGDTRIH